MKYIYILLFLLPLGLMAQPSMVHFCLTKTATSVEIKLIPDANFQGVVSNLVFTVECSDINTSFGTIQQTPTQLSYMAVEKAGNDTVVNGKKYQTYVATGLINMNDASVNQNWAQNAFIPLMKFVPSSLTPDFQLINNTYTAANNRDIYAELNGVNRTGLITCNPNVFPLPITLKAEWQQNDASLGWESVYPNIQQFQIERAIKNEKFQVIDTVNGTQFQYIDENAKRLPADYVRYQVKAIDIDGKMQVSNFQLLNIVSQFQYHYAPNPVEDKLSIEISGIEEVNIKICDAQGRICYQQIGVNTQTAIDISTFSWNSGIYYGTIEGNNHQEGFKFMKL